MAPPPQSKRHFTEEQVRSIIGRAIERQEAARADRLYEPEGLTIDEIRQLASEAGIGASFIEAAITDLESPPVAVPQQSFWGGPKVSELRRTVDTALNDETIAAMAREIRSVFKSNLGHLEPLGASFTWRPGEQSGEKLAIHAATVDGRTTIEITQSFATRMVLSHLPGGIAFFSAVLLLLAEQDLIAGTFLLGVAGVLFFAARWLAGYLARRRIEKLEGLMDDLESIAEEQGERDAITEAASPTPVPEKPAATPLLDLDDHTDAKQEESSSDARRRIRYPD